MQLLTYSLMLILLMNSQTVLCRLNSWNMMKNPFLLTFASLVPLQKRYAFSNMYFWSCATSIPLLYLSRFVYYFLCFIHFYFVNTSLQCRAFAKALHYKEMEFEGARSKKMDANPVAVVEALIHINNQLHQHEVIFLF